MEVGLFGLVVRFRLRPGADGGFDALVERTVEQIGQHEPGTLVYDVHRVADEIDVRMFYELYRDRAAFEAHESTEHTRQFLAEREHYLAGPPDVAQLDLLATARPIHGECRW